MEKGEHLKRQNRPTMLQLQYLQRLSKVEKKRGAQGSIAEYYGYIKSEKVPELLPAQDKKGRIHRLCMVQKR